MKIKNIIAREIISSGATPTIEAEVVLDSGAKGIASVPFGASAGSHEAALLLDRDPARYFGNGMLKAVDLIKTEVNTALRGVDSVNQRGVDEQLIALDGTRNKSRLGGNTLLAVSLAVARAAAISLNLPLYAYIREVFKLNIKDYVLPNPMMVVIEGGKHADGSTDLQEYLVSAYGRSTVRENVRMGIEIYHHLRKILQAKNFNINVGHEGAYAPAGITDNELPMRFIVEAIEKAGYKPGEDCGISLDAAASEFYHDGLYRLAIENRSLSAPELKDYYLSWLDKYPIATTEDMFAEDDWEAWTAFTAASKRPHIGDDLIVTNIERLKIAIEKKAANAVLVKLNQIGTLTETIDCCMMARSNNMMLVPSHRGGGETNDTFMVDLGVAVNATFIKVGPSRGERVEKYNRLMYIADELEGKSEVYGNAYHTVR